MQMGVDWRLVERGVVLRSCLDREWKLKFERHTVIGTPWQLSRLSNSHKVN